MSLNFFFKMLSMVMKGGIEFLFNKLFVRNSFIYFIFVDTNNYLEKYP